jgi:Arc/MetJ family transcription regulator
LRKEILALSERKGQHVRTRINIDDQLLADAQTASGYKSKKQTIEEALRLMIRLRRQQEVAHAFGKFRWHGNLERSRRGA